VSEISAVENLCFPQKWTKVHQNPLKSATYQLLHCAKFHRARPNDVRKKRYNFLHPSIFWRPREPPGPQFTYLSRPIDIGLQKDPDYRCANFVPLILAICLPGICCRKLLAVSLNMTLHGLISRDVIF